MLGRRVADTSHHHEFTSAYRTAVRPLPAPPQAACLQPRPAGYLMAEKQLPCGENELCILCKDLPTVEESLKTAEVKVPESDCRDVPEPGLLAL